ncbi:MAG: glycosyltransferase family 2 protein [Candidatus Latescibacterota bacterium]
MSRTVSIIMPAYNEGWCIYENIKTTLAVLAEAGISAEIVAVDDGSRDNTRAEIERAAADFEGVVAARNPYNMGKGMALRTGFECSTGDLVVFLDADLDLHPSQIQRLIETLGTGSCDIVVGSKHHPESKLDYPFSRTVASWVYYALIKTLFGLPLRDTQTGLKVFRREVLEDVFHRLLVKKFAYDIELLAAAVRFGYRVCEMPVVIDFKRQLRWGRLRFSDVLHIFVDTLAIFYRLRILRYYDAERPPLPKERKKTIIVVLGGWPSPELLERLEFFGVSRVACLLPEKQLDISDNRIPIFSDRRDLESWISEQAGTVDIVGFIGVGRLPIGSWVKSAERNFADPGIEAVCGPVIPGPFAENSERVAGMVFASPFSRGIDAHLYSYRPMKSVRKGFADNLFLRASLFAETRPEAEGFFTSPDFFHDTSPRRKRMRYDPDVAVSRRVPAFTGPYLRFIWRKTFRRGRRIWSHREPGNFLLAALPMLLAAILILGPLFLSGSVYGTLVILYLSAVFLEGLSYLSPRLSFPVMAGLVADHLTRAVAFPAGMISGLLWKEKK